MDIYPTDSHETKPSGDVTILQVKGLLRMVKLLYSTQMTILSNLAISMMKITW